MTFESGPTYKSAEEVLAKTGFWHWRVFIVVLSACSCWALNATPFMIPTFAAECDKCETEKVTIKKEFNVPAGFWGIELMSSALFLGNMCFGLITAYLADIFGRRIIILISMFCFGALGALSIFSTSYAVLLVFRFLQGAFFGTTTTVPYVLASECVEFRWHPYVIGLLGLWWSVGYSITALIGYICTTWQQMMLVTSIPSILASIYFYFTLPESFIFLVDNKRVKDINDWINRMQNPKDPVQCNVEHMLQQIDATQESMATNTLSASMKYLIHHKKYMIYLIGSTIISVFAFYLYLGVAVGTDVKLEELGPYWVYLLGGFIEIPGYLCTPIILTRFRQQYAIAGVHVFAGCALFSMVVTPSSTKTLYLIEWLVSKFAMSMCFQCMFIFVGDLYPAIIRNTCVGISTAFGNLGGMFVLQIYAEAQNVLNGKLPMLIYTAMCFINAAVIMSYPKSIGHEP
uniref:MFS domain-containing protein n=1 Tax=Panagrellus redivivus TaxID=6233 RepID=A0A7E4ZYM8_PANRE